MSPIPPDPSKLPIDLERLTQDAVAEALNHEDPGKLLEWLRAAITDYVSGDLVLPTDEPGPGRAMALVMGYALWNALPLPGNDFKPQPLPKPKVNEPCPCGSGRKFKQCCGPFWQDMPLDTAFAWPLVIVHIGPKSARQAHARGRIPAQAMVDAAQLFEERHGKPLKAARLLEALLDSPPEHPEETHAEALDRLCNLYDELHHPRKKQRLLDDMTGLDKASPLRAAAYRRCAMIAMDREEAELAWQYFRQAQRDDPRAIDLGLLEVQLLLAENRMPQAAERAGYWVRQWQRQGIEDDHPLLGFMRQIRTDPLSAMGELSARAGDGSTARLLQWLRQNAERPLPEYTFEEPEAIDPDDENLEDNLLPMLRQMGVPEDQLGPALDSLKAQFEQTAEDDPPETGDDDRLVEDPEPIPADDTEDTPPSGTLRPPEAVIRLETDWHQLFPASKPFSIQDQPFDQTDAWARAAAWLDWLERHPEAFDSIDILDDLATALLTHPEAYTPWQAQTLLLPLLERVRTIVERALADKPDSRLEWGLAENRPALRSLARLADAEQRLDHPENARACMERLLQLNPNDNHGFRQRLIDLYLQSGEDEAALALADRYPEDASPEFLFGRALACFRLDRAADADQALQTAIELNPTAADSLRRKKVREPQMIGPVRLGSEEEAWEYRESMRPVWERTPGALEWLNRTVRQQRRKER